MSDVSTVVGILGYARGRWMALGGLRQAEGYCFGHITPDAAAAIEMWNSMPNFDIKTVGLTGGKLCPTSVFTPISVSSYTQQRPPSSVRVMFGCATLPVLALLSLTPSRPPLFPMVLAPTRVCVIPPLPPSCSVATGLSRRLRTKLPWTTWS